MERIARSDLIAATLEVPRQQKAEYSAYIKNHITRLCKINPNLGELIKHIMIRNEEEHGRVALLTSEEFSEYIATFLLLIIRVSEIAESRVASE